MTMNKPGMFGLLAALSLLISSISCRKAEPSSSPAPATSNTLRAIAQPEMIQFNDARKPYFRVDLNLIKADGTVAEFTLPSDKELLDGKTIEILSPTAEPKVLHVFDEDAESASRSKREMLLLFDVSGSMNKPYGQTTLFEIAQQAAQRLLDGFQDKVDSIAIVPFESRNVAPRIVGAEFKDARADALRQIANLPQPNKEGNTALYSATLAGLEVLQGRKNAGNDCLLIVLTDGFNDVIPRRGDDDPNLLGDEGLPLLQEKARQTKIPVITIGLGRGFKEDVLRQMASPDAGNFYKAENLLELTKRFGEVRQQQTKKFGLLFTTKHTDYSQLKELDFRVRLRLANVGNVESAPLKWLCPNFASCGPDREAREEEKSAIVNSSLRSGATTTSRDKGVWRQLLDTFFILTLFSGGLAALWFLAPRVFWPRPPLPKLPARERQKTPAPRAKSKSSSSNAEQVRPAQAQARERRGFEETSIHDAPKRDKR